MTLFTCVELRAFTQSSRNQIFNLLMLVKTVCTDTSTSRRGLANSPIPDGSELILSSHVFSGLSSLNPQAQRIIRQSTSVIKWTIYNHNCDYFKVKRDFPYLQFFAVIIVSEIPTIVVVDTVVIDVTQCN